jgi:hypothetical protein
METNFNKDDLNYVINFGLQLYEFYDAIMFYMYREKKARQAEKATELHSPISAAAALDLNDIISMSELKRLLHDPNSVIFKTYLDGITDISKDKKFEFPDSQIHPTQP